MTAGALSVGPAFRKEVLSNGSPATKEFMDLGGQTYRIDRGPLSTISLDDEWYEDVADPDALVRALRASRGVGVDLLTFWQRLPDSEPRFDYHHEMVDLAVLPISSYEHWWNKQIKSRTRTQVRSAAKKGVEVRECAYDDEFVAGMTGIFNESPIRQGRPFWHYGKDAATVKAQFSRFVHRERMIGAFHEGKLIGFVMLGNAGHFGLTGQIVSSMAHRDKATNNALMAKAIELCEQDGLDYLAYFFWTNDSLAEFKRRCGFEKMSAPRYYVPLTAKGALAMRVGAHHGLKAMLPDAVKGPLKDLRRKWCEARLARQGAA